VTAERALSTLSAPVPIVVDPNTAPAVRHLVLLALGRPAPERTVRRRDRG
jgi:hypothetical protein